MASWLRRNTCTVDIICIFSFQISLIIHFNLNKTSLKFFSLLRVFASSWFKQHNMISNDILQYIPQRPPFVMVDKLLYADLEKATANFTITTENIFTENGVFSEAGLLENIAQTVAAGNGYNEQQANQKVSGGFIAGVKNFQVFFLPKVNDLLTTDIVVTGKIFNMTAISGKIMCNNELVAQCEMKIFSNTND